MLRGHGHRSGGYAWGVGRDVLTKTDARSVWRGDGATHGGKRLGGRKRQNLDGGTVRLSEDVIGKRTVETTATTTTTTKGPQGKTTSETKAAERKEVPIIRAERLAYELGVFGRTVKALVAGAGNPAIVRWPVTIWSRRR